jgi:MSHA biogenesis protein MshI
MTLRWPWTRPTSPDSLAISFDGSTLVYAQVSAVDGSRRPLLRRCGTVPVDIERPQELAGRLRALGLPTRSVIALLQVPQCQLLQIDTPAVAPEELKAAARWRIKDLVDCHVDDLTIDVMHVGDGRAHGPKQAFVAATPNRVIQDLASLCEAAGLQLATIDIRETAQRNLQCALARAGAQGDRAGALLMRHGEHCLLTICAHGELFYTRRFAWDGALAAFPSDDPTMPQSLSQPMPLLDAGEMPDIVDYGAEVTIEEDHAEAPRIVIEVQRSLDLWERSWPGLPLNTITVDAGESSGALAAVLARQLGQPVATLDPRPVFDGVMAACRGDGALARTVLPLLGALLRDDPRTR